MNQSGTSTSEPLVKRCYVIEGSAQSIPEATGEISQKRYDYVRHVLDLREHENELSRIIIDTTPSYTFVAEEYVLENGTAHVGTRYTTGHKDGLGMIRLFANSLEKMTALEKEARISRLTS